MIVAPLDAKARVTEHHVGLYGHIVKDPDSNRSELISVTAQQYQLIEQEERERGKLPACRRQSLSQAGSFRHSLDVIP